jgi:hypothetical protein
MRTGAVKLGALFAKAPRGSTGTSSRKHTPAQTTYVLKRSWRCCRMRNGNISSSEYMQCTVARIEHAYLRKRRMLMGLRAAVYGAIAMPPVALHSVRYRVCSTHSRDTATLFPFMRMQ